MRLNNFSQQVSGKSERKVEKKRLKNDESNGKYKFIVEHTFSLPFCKVSIVNS